MVTGNQGKDGGGSSGNQSSDEQESINKKM